VTRPLPGEETRLGGLDVEPEGLAGEGSEPEGSEPEDSELQRSEVQSPQQESPELQGSELQGSKLQGSEPEGSELASPAAAGEQRAAAGSPFHAAGSPQPISQGSLDPSSQPISQQSPHPSPQQSPHPSSQPISQESPQESPQERTTGEPHRPASIPEPQTPPPPSAARPATPESWSEDELVRRCRQGSEAAYYEFVRRFRPRMYTVAARLTNDPHTAEDVVQEAFLAAFRSLERFRPPSLAGWLTAITVRTAGKAVRRGRARPWLSLEALLGVGRRGTSGTGSSGVGGVSMDPPAEDPAANPHEALEAAELRRLLQRAMAELPFTHRAAVVLRDSLGFDYAEAARVMDVPLNTFKSYLLRGRRQLRDRLAGPLERGSWSGAAVAGSAGGLGSGAAGDLGSVSARGLGSGAVADLGSVSAGDLGSVSARGLGSGAVADLGSVSAGGRGSGSAAGAADATGAASDGRRATGPAAGAADATGAAPDGRRATGPAADPSMGPAGADGQGG
jgi:RNA polymerase sigma-70 factor (ECF subfamily)